MNTVKELSTPEKSLYSKYPLQLMIKDLRVRNLFPDLIYSKAPTFLQTLLHSGSSKPLIFLYVHLLRACVKGKEKREEKGRGKRKGKEFKFFKEKEITEGNSF